MVIRKCNIILEIENLLVVILISFFFSGKIKLFLTSYFVCYLFILFHELAHIVIATIFKKKIRKIKLSIAGVSVAFNNDELEIVKNILIYLAGPVSNICLAIMFYNIDFVFEINIFLAILNFMPVYPLDGYNIAKYIFKYNILKRIENTFLSLLFLISILVLMIKFNPSLLIFFIYIMLIKYVTKNRGNY